MIKCKNCNKEIKMNDDTIYISKIVLVRDRYYNLCFCNYKCLDKWIKMINYYKL